ncbi:MAG: AAA family ATPase [Myxococcales bacterium]|nr:AAA family ATPase [Myxococcales bacterium]
MQFRVVERVVRGSCFDIERGARLAGGPPVWLKRVARRQGARRLLEHDLALSRQLGPELVAVPEGIEEDPQTLALVYADAGERLLSELLEPGLVPIEDLLRWGREAAALLLRLHERGLAHGNLCSAALLVHPETDRMRLLGMHFGQRIDEEPVPLPWSLISEYSGLAPEQTGGLDHGIDQRADLYALGMMLYRMAVGELPISSERPLDWFHWHLAQRPTSPHDIRPELPELLSELILRLLAKDPLARYQSARGVHADLAQASALWEAERRIEPFELALHDQPRSLPFADRIYGRDVELAALQEAFARSRTQGLICLPLGGPSGSGKSALLDHFRRSLGPEVIVLGSKFEQFGGSQAYECAREALRSLVLDRRMAQEPGFREGLKQRLSSALGSRSRLLLELAPETEALLGPQDPLAELPADAGRRRFFRAMGDVLEILCEQAPTVILLDDLQWAGADCMDLMEALVARRGYPSLLIVFAYRSEELLPDHRLWGLMEQAAGAGGRAPAIALRPLGAPDLRRMLEDAIGEARPGSASMDLDAIVRHVLELSDGNALHARQLLSSLHQSGELRRRSESGSWSLPEGAGAEGQHSSSVDALIGLRLDALPQGTLELLRLVAMLGAKARMKDLELLLDEPAEGILRVLGPALAASLLSQREDRLELVHDRVQAALLSPLDAEARAALHQRIGWDLLRRLSPRGREARLLELVDHINRAPLPAGGVMRQERLALNLRAARRALAEGARGQATLYARGAQRLLLSSDPRAQRMRVALCASRALYLSGEHVPARREAALALELSESFPERVMAYGLLKAIVLTEGEGGAEIIVRGRELLADVYPDSIWACRSTDSSGSPAPCRGPECSRAIVFAHEQDLAFVERWLRLHSSEALLALPRSDEPEVDALVRLLTDLWEAAYYAADAATMRFAITRIVRLAIERGSVPGAAFGFVFFGATLVAEGQLELAFDVAHAGLELARRSGDLELLPKVINLFCNYSSHYRRPFESSVQLYEQSTRIAHENGDILFGLWAAFFSVWSALIAGRPLGSVIRRAQEVESIVEGSHDEKMNHAFAALRLHLLELQGAAPGERSRQDERSAWERVWSRDRFAPGPTWLALWDAQAAYLRGEPARALELLSASALETDPLLIMFPITELYFYRGLSAAACLGDELAAEERRVLDALLDADLERIRQAERVCPVNFRHQRLLVEAERARSSDRQARAAALYEEAIDWAQQERLPFALALGYELASRYWLAAGRRRFGTHYLVEAIRHYRSWGALGKARELERRHREEADPGALQPWSPDRERVELTELALVDLPSVLEASQLLTQELDLEALLGKALCLLIGSSGAERGCVGVLDADGRVHAHFVEDLHDARLRELAPAEPLLAPYRILSSVIEEGQPLLVHAAQRDERWRDDPYLRAGGVRSFLALPAIWRGEVKAVFFLENSLSSDAFTEARAELFRPLLTQIGISIVNSGLYQELRAEALERNRAEVELSRREARFARIFEYAQAACFEWSFEQERMIWSPRWGETLGWPPHVPITLETLRARVDSRDLESVERALARCVQGQPLDARFRVRNSEGEQRWISLVGDISRDDQGRPQLLLGALRDITEATAETEAHAGLERQLLQAQKMESLGRLTTGIAHDFNNVLQVVGGVTEIAIERALCHDDRSLSQDLRRIRACVFDAAHMVSLMLAFGRGEAASPAAGDIQAVSLEIAGLLSAFVESSVEVDFDPGRGPLYAIHDAVQLKQMILNCCINARDAMPDGGRLTLSTRAAKGLRAVCDSCHQAIAGDYVEIRVGDEGAGMAPAILARIFEPLFTTKGEAGGSGMGLSTLHGMLHGIDGHVLVETEIGRGSVFRLLMPRVSAASPSGVRPRPTPSAGSWRQHLGVSAEGGAPSLATSRPVAAIVDDDPALASLLAHRLRTMGLEAALFVGAREFLEALDSGSLLPSLVVTDLHMPGMGGLELIEALSARQPRLPVLLVTASPQRAEGVSAASGGLVQVVAKPVLGDALQRAVGSVLAARPQAVEG